MNMIPAGGVWVADIGVTAGKVVIDLNKVPVRPETVGPSVLDEEEVVGVRGDSRCQIRGREGGG